MGWIPNLDSYDPFYLTMLDFYGFKQVSPIQHCNYTLCPTIRHRRGALIYQTTNS